MGTFTKQVLAAFPLRDMLKAKKVLARKFFRGLVCAGLGCIMMAPQTYGQTRAISLNDMSSFRDPGSSWQIAGDVNADLNKTNVLKTSGGIQYSTPGRQ